MRPIVFLMLGLATLCTSSMAQNTEKQGQVPSKSDWELLFPEGEGKSYVIGLCQQCHTLERVAILRGDEPSWRSVLVRMNVRGANLYDEDMDIIAKYLADAMGPNRPPLKLPVNLNSATSDELSLFPQLTKDESVKILEARKKQPFKDVADLKQAISEDKIAKIKPFVVVH